MGGVVSYWGDQGDKVQKLKAALNEIRVEIFYAEKMFFSYWTFN